MLRESRGTLVVIVCAAIVLLAAVPAVAQSETALERIEAHANNKPLASLAAAAAQARARGPKAGPPREVPNFLGEGRPAPTGREWPRRRLWCRTPRARATASIESGFFGATNNDNVTSLAS